MTDPPRTTSISLIYARPIKSEYFLGQQPHENFFKKIHLRKRTTVYPVWKISNTLRCSLPRATAFYMSLYAASYSDCSHSCIRYQAYSRSIGSRVTWRRRNGALILINNTYVSFFYWWLENLLIPEAISTLDHQQLYFMRLISTEFSGGAEEIEKAEEGQSFSERRWILEGLDCKYTNPKNKD